MVMKDHDLNEAFLIRSNLSLRTPLYGHFAKKNNEKQLYLYTVRFKARSFWDHVHETNISNKHNIFLLAGGWPAGCV